MHCQGALLIYEGSTKFIVESFKITFSTRNFNKQILQLKYYLLQIQHDKPRCML